MNTKPNEELREQIYDKLKSDKRADTYVIPTRVMDTIVEFIQTEIAEAERRARKQENRIYLRAAEASKGIGDVIRLDTIRKYAKDRIKQLTEIEV